MHQDSNSRKWVATDTLSPQDEGKCHTFGDEDIDGRRLRVGSTARVVARVGIVCVSYGQTTLRLEAWLRLHCDATSRRIVVDHAIVMVPEHVLRWGGTLQRKSDGKHETAFGHYRYRLLRL
jgi:hypothetical protein